MDDKRRIFGIFCFNDKPIIEIDRQPQQQHHYHLRLRDDNNNGWWR
jgi:hypothetical protein